MNVIEKDDHAPDFELYGIHDDERNLYRLSQAGQNGNYTLLLFYPMDFSPVCTAELCSVRDGNWFNEISNLEVWGISADSLYCHREFADKHRLNYPLLSDQHGEIAERYGVRYDWWDGHLDVPKRSMFLVTPDQRVEYAWSTDDAYATPDFEPVKQVLDEIGETMDVDMDYDGLHAQVNYEDSIESRVD